MEANKPYHILLVEDDPNFGLVLKSFLEIKNFEITLCDSGATALSKIKTSHFDLFVLDVMLPDIDGFTIAQEIKKLKIPAPFIFLTARALKEDKIKGYEIGALDYLVKPFDPEILFFKINAILSLESKEVNEVDTVLTLGNFSLDTVQQLLILGQAEIKLTYKEAQLLKMLIAHKDDVLLRSDALRTLWQEDNYFTTKSMDVYITKLRKHLKKDTLNHIEIQNIHGKGFRLLIQPNN